MTIKLYTYSNPYYISSESYWNEIKDAPIFTASQTLANGMKLIYGVENQITTITELINKLFISWTSVDSTIKQHAAIDNIINNYDFSNFDEHTKNNLSRAFTFNRDEVFKSIRTLFELGILYDHVDTRIITKEQKFLLDLFNQIKNSNYSRDFVIDTNFNCDDVSNAIKKSLPNFPYDETSNNTIVIQGVHQFTPLILKTIEEISKYKNVILLFNYQSQFKSIYDTWINIYSCFEEKIEIYDGKVSYPNEDAINYKGVMLANDIGKLAEGNYSDIKNEQFEIIEFDNVMEFASYVADVYATALRIKGDKNINPLKLMSEQFYSANDMVNSILKMYYPEQFGERHFLNYPLGQFFVAITMMWDADNNEHYITDLNSIKECFSSNIIDEKAPGYLNTLFEKAKPMFEDCITIKKMIKRIERVRKEVRKSSDDLLIKEKLNRVSYLALTDEEINELLIGLKDLDEISTEFFHDFKYGATSFKLFYQNIKAKLEDKLEDFRDMDEEFASIISRVLERLNQVDSIDANASFQCLKSTMSIYLQQESFNASKANWIVRNFEQIDGDIMLSRINKSVYHFACLNDSNLIANKNSRYSWPLDEDFFVMAQTPSDWKYMTYVTAKNEYLNFKRYALFYGLLFNKSTFKLSYIKHDDDKELEVYYLLKLLNHTTTNFEEQRFSKYIPVDNSEIDLAQDVNYNSVDYYKYKICKYKFLLESLIENNTVYKDQFLIRKYIEVLLENNMKLDFEGNTISEMLIDNQINTVYSSLKRKYFPFIKTTDEIDIKKTVKERLLKIKKKVNYSISDFEKQYMKIKEYFIHYQLSKNGEKVFTPITQSEIDNFMEINKIYSNKFFTTHSAWCKYCPNREICGIKINDE